MQSCQPHSFSCQIALDIIDNHLLTPLSSHYSINSKLKCNLLLASDKVAPLLLPSVNSNILKDDAMQSILIVFAFRGWGTGRGNASYFVSCFLILLPSWRRCSAPHGELTPLQILSISIILHNIRRPGLWLQSIFLLRFMFSEEFCWMLMHNSVNLIRCDYNGGEVRNFTRKRAKITSSEGRERWQSRF